MDPTSHPINNGMGYHLAIESDRGLLNVKWDNIDQLAKYANIQSGFYLTGATSYGVDLHAEHFQRWNQLFWTQRQNLGMFNLPNDATIVDVGCGIAVVDLLLYSYLPSSNFFLIDRTNVDIESLGNNLPNICYAEDYPVYHSWEPIVDAIESSNFDRKRFNFLDCEHNIPDGVDCITSYLSWCFHYPKERYWHYIDKLKPGGKLILDVRTLGNRDVIKEITNELGVEPVQWAFPTVSVSVDRLSNETVAGHRCMWTKR
jgi:precorrin-6B methylase 2